MTNTTATSPTRIVAYDEGYGEWTIEAADDNGTCVKDAAGHDLACWFNHEGDDEFVPMTMEEAVAAAEKDFCVAGLPVFVWEDGGMVPAAS
jgi:hypothetical protein